MGSSHSQKLETHASGTLPVLRFNTETFEKDVRLDALNTFSSGLYTYRPNRDDGSAPRLDLEAWALDGIAAASLNYGPTLVQAPQRIDPNFEDMTFLRWVKSGHVRVELGDTRQEFGPGSLFLMKARHKLHCPDEGTSVSLRLPCDRVGQDALHRTPVMPLRTDTWQGRILMSTIEALFETLPEMTSMDAPLFADQIAALVRSLPELDQHDDTASTCLKSNRTQAMRRFLLEHLDRPNLGVSDLQVEFNASRATVYRAFEELGGVANFVREHRLAAIYRDLRMCMAAHGRIRCIAEQHGFFDQTSFLRSFRAQYGLRPSEILGAAYVNESASCNGAAEGVQCLASLASFWRQAH
ncbi:MAG: AraC family transcriptional regulator [Pseudomonadota bacterium]